MWHRSTSTKDAVGHWLLVCIGTWMHWPNTIYLGLFVLPDSARLACLFFSYSMQFTTPCKPITGLCHRFTQSLLHNRTHKRVHSHICHSVSSSVCCQLVNHTLVKQLIYNLEVNTQRMPTQYAEQVVSPSWRGISKIPPCQRVILVINERSRMEIKSQIKRFIWTFSKDVCI